MKKKMLILMAPSGGGKSTFLRKLLEENQDFKTTVTYTTRAMRKGEVEGKSYFFVDKERFEQLKSEDFFVEWAVVHGNLYGTPAHQINDIWQAGCHVIMDIDVQGAEVFKKKYPQALTIFITAPSIDVLRQRVVDREGKVPGDLEVRMETARREIEIAHTFDHLLVNDEFEASYANFKKLVEEYLKSP